ncbi:MAG: hypothetical protein KAJ19_22930 [Gammaproteobacteria bacterium]|nr:hypothetical protein [Gammaproteobacteria bacterium]
MDSQAKYTKARELIEDGLDYTEAIEKVDIELTTLIEWWILAGPQDIPTSLLGPAAAWCHNGGPDHQGMSWQQVADSFGVEVRILRDKGRCYLGAQNWDRWGVEKGTPSITSEREGNYLTVTGTKLDRIIEIDELIKRAGWDPKEWVVERQKVKKYEGYRSDVHKDLVFDEGKITGSIQDDGQMTTVELFTMEAHAVRRNPEPIFAVIKRIQVSAEFKKPEPPARRPYKRHLIFADPHFGFKRELANYGELFEFHNRNSLDLAVQLAEYIHPDEIHVMGDWLDLAEFSDKFLRSPGMLFTLQPALAESSWWLQQFAAIGKTWLHEGNHDKRLPMAIKKHLPAAHGIRKASQSVFQAPSVMSLEYLLELQEMGVTWVGDYPNDRHWIANNWCLYHGFQSRGDVLDLGKALARWRSSRICGHNHKPVLGTEIQEGEDTEQEVVTGIGLGCMCRTDYEVPGQKHNQYWANQLQVVDVFDFNYVQPVGVSLDHGVAIYDGKLFESRDRFDELMGALPDKYNLNAWVSKS